MVRTAQSPEAPYHFIRFQVKKNGQGQINLPKRIYDEVLHWKHGDLIGIPRAEDGNFTGTERDGVAVGVIVEKPPPGVEAPTPKFPRRRRGSCRHQGNPEDADYCQHCGKRVKQL